MTKKSNGVMRINEIIHSEPPRLLVLYEQGQEEIVRVFADIVGQSFAIVDSLEDAVRTDSGAIGLEYDVNYEPDSLRTTRWTVIATHAIYTKDIRDGRILTFCDYEYLYDSRQPSRRAITRWLAFVLGQSRPYEALITKPRTTMLSTTFPDIRDGLPNMHILSVGADAVELRVDLLKDDEVCKGQISVPSLRYVGEQIAALRQRTELPIIFTTRCTKENGKFPMDDPMLSYEYLKKAIQWGCEFIDVELRLPAELRRRLAGEKGNSKIISAWHDFSGHFRWTSPEAHQTFVEAAKYADVVKMIAIADSKDDNYELETFRNSVFADHPGTPFSGVNMGPAGQLSRTLNRVLSPITHSLLPTVAAPGQLSAAEINAMLSSMGQLQKRNIYAIGNVRANGQAMFLEKCMNELSLPHQVICADSLALDFILQDEEVGGAYLNPPHPLHPTNSTNAASKIGYFDTVVVSQGPNGNSALCDNVAWKGIRATLTRDFVSAAFAGRSAVILANAEAQAIAAIHALKDLDIGTIYTIGFQASAAHGGQVQQLRGVEDMNRIEDPFVLISALPPEKSLVVKPLLKYYGVGLQKLQRSGKIFLDLYNGVKGHGDSVTIAASLGWRSSGIAVVKNFTMVETLRLLLGVHVGYDFVRLASGRCLYS